MSEGSLPEEPLRPRNSGAAAALYIRRLIFDGDLRPGDRVNQDEVARALGISRIPVREALIAVERQGWVTIEPNRGAFVVALDEQAVRDHYEMFGLVYGFTARKAIERADASLGDKLMQIAHDFSHTNEPNEAQQLVLAFHGALIDAASSPRIIVVLRAMSGSGAGRLLRDRAGGAPPAAARADRDRASMPQA